VFYIDQQISYTCVRNIKVTLNYAIYNKLNPFKQHCAVFKLGIPMFGIS